MPYCLVWLLLAVLRAALAQDEGERSVPTASSFTASTTLSDITLPSLLTNQSSGSSNASPTSSLVQGLPLASGPSFTGSEVVTTSTSSIGTADSVSIVATSLTIPSTSAPQSTGLTNECNHSTVANEGEELGSALTYLLEPKHSRWLEDSHGTPYLPVAPVSVPPWGNASVTNSDATILRSIPVTNITRRYNFVISRGRISPDGVLRDVILIDNQFPGSIIEANWGDWIEVNVTNGITAPGEGTTLHWHGMLQRKTPWQDGVSGVGQCPIAPGTSLTYRFQAEVHGTSWYHAHYSSQYTAGVAGPVVVYGPSSLSYDIDLGPVMLSDWNHIPYFSMVANTVGTNRSVVPPRSDNNLINGRGRYNCSTPSYSGTSDWLGSNLRSNLTWTCIENASLTSFGFTSGKTYRLRLINHGADGIQKFSIDGHSMTVIATDFVPVVPYNAAVITLAVGQRTDVLVTANQRPESSWWMRTQTPGWPFCGEAVNAEGRAKIYYEASDRCFEPTSEPLPAIPLACENDALDITRPAYSIAPDPAAFILDIVVTLRINETRHAEWCINNQTFRTDYSDPVMFRAQRGQTNFTDKSEWAVYNLAQNASVILNISNQTPFAHPFHLHGHSFYVLKEGRGSWDGGVINAMGPMRRDVQIVQGFGYAAVQVDLDNPGVWPFHCHAAWHLSGGLNMNLLSHPSEIPSPPETMVGSCVAWNSWTENHVVDQIDSGS